MKLEKQNNWYLGGVVGKCGKKTKRLRVRVCACTQRSLENHSTTPPLHHTLIQLSSK